MPPANPRRYHWNRRHLEERIAEEVVPRVVEVEPATADCPSACLCHNVTNRRIAELVSQYADGTTRTDGVYVLQCKSRAVSQKVVREELKLQTDSRWTETAQAADRLLYIGVSQNVVNRLKQHARASGNGANFTQIFPASRVLSISWHDSTPLAYEAETITAEAIDGATDDGTFVYQPG